MLLQNLPPAKRTFAVAGFAMIHRALRNALGESSSEPFTHIAVVEKEPQSIRVFLTGNVKPEGFVDLPHPFTALEMATELMRFSREDARYEDFSQSASLLFSKGWLVKRMDFDGIPGVVVIATWVAAS